MTTRATTAALLAAATLAALPFPARAGDTIWSRASALAASTCNSAATLASNTCDSAADLATDAGRLAARAARTTATLAIAAYEETLGAGEAAVEYVAGAAQSAKDSVIDAAHAAAPPRGVFLLDTPARAAREGRALDSWRPLHETPRIPPHVVLLVHGLSEPGTVWDEMAHALQREGYTVARFDYLNDQAIASTAGVLAQALQELKAHGAQEVDLVCHSMGGLVAHDVLTRDAFYAGRARGHEKLPDIPRLVMIGTPAAGSWWAHLSPVADLSEHYRRWESSPTRDPRLLLGFLADGDGNASRDLVPGSAFLTDLSARPAPEGVRTTAVVGVIADLDESDLSCLTGPSWARRALGRDAMACVASNITSAAGWLGDGVVSTHSASAAGTGEIIRVHADHRSLLRSHSALGLAHKITRGQTPMPPGIAVTLDALAR